jgi:hypothetical protein
MNFSQIALLSSHQVTNMKKLTKLSIVAISAAALVACGGGDSSPSTPAPPPTTPGVTVNEVPLVTSVPAAYSMNSVERGAFDEANRARSECGLGMATTDPRLDMAADMHARYLTVQKGNNPTPHFQTNLANPWYRGNSPVNRAQVAGYAHASSVSEGMSLSNSLVLRGPWTELELGAISTKNLLNAPYHALDMLAPRLHHSVGATWSTRLGLTNDHPSAGAGIEWGAIVHEYGTLVNQQGIQTVQAIPANDVLTWPCSATSSLVHPHFFGENPNPLPDRLGTNLAGSPFYFISRVGSNMTIKSARLFNATTGVEIPLMTVRHMRNELYPGTSSLFSVTSLMESAFVFPDVPLPASSLLRMDFTATVSGRDVTKSVTYRTGTL